MALVDEAEVTEEEEDVTWPACVKPSKQERRKRRKGGGGGQRHGHRGGHYRARDESGGHVRHGASRDLSRERTAGNNSSSRSRQDTEGPPLNWIEDEDEDGRRETARSPPDNQAGSFKSWTPTLVSLSPSLSPLMRFVFKVLRGENVVVLVVEGRFTHRTIPTTTSITKWN